MQKGRIAMDMACSLARSYQRTEPAFLNLLRSWHLMTESLWLRLAFR